MKKILNYLGITVAVFLFVFAFGITSQAHAATALPTPGILVGSSGSNASYILTLPNAGPFTQDFKIQICLYASDFNGWGPLCMTSPWASQMSTGSWVTTGQDGSHNPITFRNTGEKSVWGYPGHADELVTTNGVATASMTVIPGSPLPTGEFINDLKIGLQTSEDNSSTLTGLNLYDGSDGQLLCLNLGGTSQTDPGSMGVSFTGDQYDAAGSSLGIWSVTASNCSASFSPDVARMWMNDTVDNAAASSNNIPITFNVSQSKTIGTDGQPLEISVMNTGSTPWSGYVTSIVPTTEVGTCTDPVAACPDPATNPVGAQCVVTTDNSSWGFKLQHISGSFAVGNNPATLHQAGTQTCSVVMGCINAYSGSQSCNNDAATCQAWNSGSGCYVSGIFNGTIDPIACVQLGGSWTNPICGGTWGPTLGVTNTATSVSPGSVAKFTLGSLTAPATPGTYIENWQMLSAASTRYTTVHNFGSVIPIRINVTSGGIAISCSPSTITVTGTSNCIETSGQPVTWSSGPGGTITSGGVFTPSGPGTVTITGTSIANPTQTNTTTITVTSGPVGTITVYSENSQNNTQFVPATWSFSLYPSADPCQVSGANCSNATSSVSAGLPYGIYAICSANSANCHATYSTQYAFNSIKQIDHTDNALALFGINMAKAITFPSGFPPVQSLVGPSTQFVLLWNPIANMTLTPNPVQVSAVAGTGVSGNSTVTLTNTGASSSQLTWSAVSNNSWLTLNPASNSSQIGSGGFDTIIITAVPGSFPAGSTQTGTITFTGHSVIDNSPKYQTLTVIFHVTPPGGVPVSITCSPSTITVTGTSNCMETSGQPVTWSSGPGGTITSGGVFTPTGVGTITITGTSIANPTQTNTTTITVTSGPVACGGSSPCGLCTFSASPSTIIPPQKSTLNYSCTSVKTCQITGGSSVIPVPVNGSTNSVTGSTIVSPVTTTTYTLSCRGSNGGSVSYPVQVKVGNLILCESNPGGTNCP